MISVKDQDLALMICCPLLQSLQGETYCFDLFREFRERSLCRWCVIFGFSDGLCRMQGLPIFNRRCTDEIFETQRSLQEAVAVLFQFFTKLRQHIVLGFKGVQPTGEIQSVALEFQQLLLEFGNFDPAL